MSRNRRALLGLVVAALALSGCPDDEDEPTLAKDIFAQQLGGPIPAATLEQKATFERGKAIALKRFTVEEGLGPQFNAAFCTTCHEKPVPGGSASRYRNFLLVGQELSDGSFTAVGLNGVQLNYDVEGRRVPTDPAANVMATRNPIPFFGTGLLAEIPEEEILRYADPDDADGDGISGRPNWDRGFVGRFGRKAQTVSIEGFIRGPLFNHVGITSNPLSNEQKARLPVASDVSEDELSQREGALAVVHLAQAAAPDEPTEDQDAAPDPELSGDDLFDLVSFSMLIAPPKPDEPTETSRAGEALFEEIGCAACHVPALEGPRGLIPAYTDLLLHDMGDELADGIPMGVATGREFRTQPLWGVTAVAPYLHDGRADTLDEAIRLHGGESEDSRDRYEQLNTDEQAQVLAFLDSLGGAREATAGLVPPGAPIPAVGAYGGPMHALDGAGYAQFELGREVFDRDVFASEGLGPVFNGDACRSCHFDPVIGGAGPNDVNVIRHGTIEATGAFTAPAGGTIAHRHAIEPGARPPAMVGHNHTEQRQTPPVFGLGLVDRIPEATIIALEDPDDLDNDGISGRAHVLTDGRLGRLGWKAQVPSLAEFSRDAGSAELGLTVPQQAGLSFGASTDGDAAADPELSLEDIEALTFFMSQLAPPPRSRTQPALEDEGEQLFEDVGCADCHTPTLKTSDGVDVPLYSNLLLHDVAPMDASGVVDGNATAREFRTPPLWGLSRTGPYMHDGRSYTVEDSIARHEGEAEDSRLSYEQATAAEREALLAFLRSL